MPPITPDQLSDEVQKILNAETDVWACYTDQPVCMTDPRVTAQLVEDQGEPRVRPARIKNAEKGDLILCPGGPEGVIGNLLLHLDPGQLYSHMGIMTKDQTEIRQSTALEDRLRKFPHHFPQPDNECSPTTFFLPKLFGDPPTDGFQECALRYGWPGTITQTVHVAWLNWQWSDIKLEDLDKNLHLKPWRVIYEEALQDADKKPIKDRLIIEDSQLGDRDDDNNAFKVNSITLGHVQMPDGQIVPPIVVKPCDALRSKAVQDALDRVVEAAKEMRGHYRFFAYTRADIGLDPAQNGSSALLEKTQPDLSSLCKGQKPQIPTESTVAMVCSTFIWLAVQRANQNRAPGQPRIILDGRGENRNPANYLEQCGESAMPRETYLDKLDRQTPDGLYFYGESERSKAGEGLYKFNKESVVKEVLESADLLKALKDKMRDSSLVYSLWQIAKLILEYGLGFVGKVLAIADDVLAALITFLTDMPDDIANQICNAFANDDCTISAKDSTAWRDHPGNGYTVSPDNIMRSWAAPTSADREIIHGLYGYNEVADVLPPEWWRNPPPKCTWQISQGMGYATGIVIFEGVPVANADVRIGCTRLRTNQAGSFDQSVPQGIYWCDAQYRHPITKYLLESDGQAVKVPSDEQIVIVLNEPPVSRRRIWFNGKINLVNRHAGAEVPLLNEIIKDWEKSSSIDSRSLSDAYLDNEAFFFPPDNPKYKELRDSYQRVPRGDSFAIEDWGWADVSFDLEIQPDNSVKVKYRARLRDSGDPDWMEDHDYGIKPDTSLNITTDLRTGIWPARAHIEITIHNDRVP